MARTIARPDRTAGRIIVGPRQVETGLARIVACEDGSGRIELYDAVSRVWCDAADECTFSEIWSAPAVLEPFSGEAWLNAPTMRATSTDGDQLAAE